MILLRSGCVDYIIGGCMMIRRSAFAAIGPLDEKYFLYYEDTDWCYRAHLKGWKIGYLPRPSIVHDYKRSSSKVSFTEPSTLGTPDERLSLLLESSWRSRAKSDHLSRALLPTGLALRTLSRKIDPAKAEPIMIVTVNDGLSK